MMQRANDALGIGIVVNNIDASLKFYQETLGLEFVQKLPTRTGTGTMYRLRFGNIDFKLLESPKDPPNGPVGLTAQLGFRYVPVKSNPTIKSFWIMANHFKE